MAKTGRNQPCPCGSGKKYKRCCLRKDEAQQVEERRQAEERHGTTASLHSPADLVEDDDLDLLDDRSNLVVHLINGGRLDEAEEAARDLLDRYPGFPDGDLRLAMVFEARKQPELAAEHYRKAAACLGDDCAEGRDDLLRKADQLSKAEQGERATVRVGEGSGRFTLTKLARESPWDPRRERSL
jgi:tetratricopeptide (TPR) repeat protein